MGTAKLTLPWKNSTVIETVLDQWLQSQVTEVIVVVDRMRGGPLARCIGQRERVRVVEADEPPEMKDSIAAALHDLQQRQLLQPDDAWLVAPADLPRLSSQVIDRLLTVWQQLLANQHSAPRRSEILVPVSAGRRGHPVLFAGRLAAEVDLLPEDQGVNRLLQQHPVQQIDCQGLLRFGDLDTPEDYRRLKEEE